MIAFHAILSAYGFWLPNDPRGSWSNYVGNRELHQFAGDATHVATQRSLAHVPHDISFRITAKSKLLYPAVRFTGKQARSIAHGFETVAATSHYSILALAILPSHTHIVVGYNGREPSRVIGHLKRGATDRLINDRTHPCFVDERITHACWAKQAWKVFIDTDDHLAEAIRYVEHNPIKEGMPRQYWSFVDTTRQRWFATARQAGRLTPQPRVNR